MDQDVTPTPDSDGDILSELGLTPTGTGDAATPQATPQGTQTNGSGAEQSFKFLGRDYKSVQDAENSLKGLRSEFDKRNQKLNQLESILKNPNLLKAAMQDPQLAESLVKMGLVKRGQEMAARGQEDIDPDEVDWDTPEAQIATLRAEWQMEREFNSLQKELGRDMNEQERDEVLNIVVAAGGHLSVKQAWKLTPSYEKSLVERQNKAIEQARSKGRVNRPSPTPGVLPGQKIDTKKPVRDMSANEFRESLREDIEKMM